MLYSTSISLAMISLFALFLIPGLSSLPTSFAQYDVPNMDDFDIPTQEEIEKMMEKQEVKERYVNSDFGVEVTIPDGWSGMASDYKDPTTDEWITGFQVMPGGLEANMDSIQDGEFEIIALSIMDKSQDDNTDPPEVKAPGEDYDVECNVVNAEKISVNDKDVMKLEAQCEGDISMKTKMYHYATNEKTISYAYMTSPSSSFDNNINNFEVSVSTLQIANQVSVSYEIPEDMMGESSNSDTDEAMDDTDEAMDDTDEAMDDTDEAMDDTDEMIPVQVMSPRKQLESGVSSSDIQCNEGKELLVKTSTGLSTCVKSTSLTKLIERGWGTLP